MPTRSLLINQITLWSLSLILLYLNQANTFSVIQLFFIGQSIQVLKSKTLLRWPAYSRKLTHIFISIVGYILGLYMSVSWTDIVMLTLMTGQILLGVGFYLTRIDNFIREVTGCSSKKPHKQLGKLIWLVVLINVATIFRQLDWWLELPMMIGVGGLAVMATKLI